MCREGVEPSFTGQHGSRTDDLNGAILEQRTKGVGTIITMVVIVLKLCGRFEATTISHTDWNIKKKKMIKICHPMMCTPGIEPRISKCTTFFDNPMYPGNITSHDHVS